MTKKISVREMFRTSVIIFVLAGFTVGSLVGAGWMVAKGIEKSDLLFFCGFMGILSLLYFAHYYTVNEI
jgi:hypothetical protein